MSLFDLEGFLKSDLFKNSQGQYINETLLDFFNSCNGIKNFKHLYIKHHYYNNQKILVDNKVFKYSDFSPDLTGIKFQVFRIMPKFMNLEKR